MSIHSHPTLAELETAGPAIRALVRRLVRDEAHDGAWWGTWWDNNKHRFPPDVRAMEIPRLDYRAKGVTGD